MFGFNDSEFKKSTATIFIALLLFGFVPIIGDLIRLVPLFKEVVLGAVVVAVFTSVSDTGTGVKFALASGMIAAVLFNIIYIPGQTLLGGVFGALGSSGSDAAAVGGMSAMFSGLGALTNLIGLIFMSPIGYAIGGAIGSVVNQ
jgi:hypothetical protein